jgi:hypothetical protein
MWIASHFGFFSIVFKEGHWHVRARQKSELEELTGAAKLTAKIEEWPQADYRWRVRLKDGADLERVFDALRESVTYSNFKSHIGTLPKQRAKLPAYHELWSGLYAIQK